MPETKENLTKKEVEALMEAFKNMPKLSNDSKIPEPNPIESGTPESIEDIALSMVKDIMVESPAYQLRMIEIINMVFHENIVRLSNECADRLSTLQEVERSYKKLFQ